MSRNTLRFLCHRCSESCLKMSTKSGKNIRHFLRRTRVRSSASQKELSSNPMHEKFLPTALMDPSTLAGRSSPQVQLCVYLLIRSRKYLLPLQLFLLPLSKDQNSSHSQKTSHPRLLRCTSALTRYIKINAY